MGTARRRAYSFGLQHPKRIYTSPRVASSWRDANLCQDVDWQDHHTRSRTIRLDRQCESQDPRQGRNPTRSATIDFCWQAARRRPYPFGLQHPKGIYTSSCVASSWRDANLILSLTTSFITSFTLITFLFSLFSFFLF